MAANIIHVLGASGSGTTTLGQAIAKAWGYAHFDTDDYYWVPTDPMFQQNRPPAERLRLLQRDISAHPRCVISGAFVRWGDPLIPLLDLAVWLQTPTETRLARLRRREAARFGSRIEPGGDMYEEHREFMAWAALYDTADDGDTRSFAQHRRWTQQLPCPCLTADGTQPVEELLKLIEPWL